MTAVAMDPRLRARRTDVLRQRGRRRLAFIVALVVVGCVVAATYGLLHSPAFDVDRILVDGTEHVSAESVVGVAGIELGAPMSELDLAAARDSIAALPWVDAVASEQNWPSEVRFTVTERAPVATLAVGTTWLTVDATGRVLESATEAPLGLVVLGRPTWAAEPGQWIPNEALAAVDLVGAMPPRLAELSRSAEVIDGEVWIDLAAGGRVRLGDEREMEQKLVSAVTVLLRVETACLDELDVRVPASPVLTRQADCT
ncbi:MAG: FtsQ-type POTRA domain-containing protein [Acidimicrobiales bacterium]|nr:FtsQ-type POTRA domain-containing protein [Acidimicrobiales bacterium]